MNGSLALSEVFNHPSVKELANENDLLRSVLTPEQLTKIKYAELDELDLPYVLQNKILMEEGEFNGLFYPKQELMHDLKNDVREEFNLICDHLDTRNNSGVQSYAGAVLNRHWDDNGEKGPGVYGDIHIRDASLAKKIALGAKWGISPTYDYEEAELDGQSVGTNLSTVSYSLVLDPAVKKTMLNNSGGINTMNNQNELAKKKLKYKYPYKYPYKGPAGAEMQQEVEVDSPTWAILQDAEIRIKELSDFKDNTEKNELSSKVDSIVANEFLMERVDEGELDSRRNELMLKSREVLNEIQDIIGDHAELESYTQFVKNWLKKNPGKSIKDAAGAWRKQKGEMQDFDDDENDDTKELSSMSKSSKTSKEIAELSKTPNNIDQKFASFLTNDASRSARRLQ